MWSRNQLIMNHFSDQESWEKNYRKIIELGKKLEFFKEEDKQEKWLIKACQSPLWLKVDRNSKGELIFTGDSEGLISKGLLALIIEFYTNREPGEILQDKPEFIESLDLSQYLSTRRTNGLQAILDQVIKYAKTFFILSQSNTDPI